MRSESDGAMPCGDVLLCGVDTTTAMRLRGATDSAAAEITARTADRVEDCAVLAERNLATCVVAPTRPSINARLVDAADPAFRRTTLITLCEGESEATLWRRLAWDVITPETPDAQIPDMLLAAIVEADLRRREWDLVNEYYRRRSTLTADEEEVLEAVVAGKLNKQIASEFRVSIRTVEQRRRRVFSKMDVPSAVPLADRVATVRTLEGRRFRRDRAEAHTATRHVSAINASAEQTLRGEPYR